MDTSQPVERKHLVSVVLPNLGWFAAALIAVWFFVSVKPGAHALGYTQGTADQNAMDKVTYETATGGDSSPSIGSTINLRVVRVQTGSISGDTLVFNNENPFGKTAERKTVVYDKNTVIVKRIVLAPAEYERRIKAAEAKGENSLMVAPFDDLPATIADINPSDRMEVDVANVDLLQSPSFLAQLIAIVLPATAQP